MTTAIRTLTIRLVEDGSGWITASVDEEPAVISQGKTEDEALENVLAALRDLRAG